MSKPVVHYKNEAEIYKWPFKVNDEEIYVARLNFVWDHPILGAETNVRTSQILTMPDKDGTFETLNTVYVRTDNYASSQED